MSAGMYLCRAVNLFRGPNVRAASPATSDSGLSRIIRKADGPTHYLAVGNVYTRVLNGQLTEHGAEKLLGQSLQDASKPYNSAEIDEVMSFARAIFPSSEYGYGGWVNSPLFQIVLKQTYIGQIPQPTFFIQPNSRSNQHHNGSDG